MREADGGAFERHLYFSLHFRWPLLKLTLFLIFIPTSLLPLSNFNTAKFSKDPPLILLWICVFSEVWRRITTVTIVLVKEGSLQRTVLSTLLRVSTEKAPNNLGAWIGSTLTSFSICWTNFRKHRKSLVLSWLDHHSTARKFPEARRKPGACRQIRSGYRILLLITISLFPPPSCT